MEHLKKAVAQWELANEKYKKDTQQHSQRISSVLRTFWALDMSKNADNIKSSIAIVGMFKISISNSKITIQRVLFKKLNDPCWKIPTNSTNSWQPSIKNLPTF